MTARVQARRLVLEKEKIIESELKGLTLRVYWHILGSHKKDSIGVRAVQRALGLSSPSVSLHHLEKLRLLGLLEKDFTGEYRLVNEVEGGGFSNFFCLFFLVLSRFLFYSTMFN